MNQQEVRSKYYLHSDDFYPDTASFFFFSEKTICKFFGNALVLL
ncbi:hypothetical protein HMPREF1981_01842 [Bacteroides pyogenes F0041]|uniref:Uncharacterized protein n=1 Tax=Bacteroides pyogenes F0041 TaxID=1321819 RepID=U2CL77_9BACE|nr:hypothetical protein HMPREF1981_01842 [Bacteroides pyogenes F0041]